MKRAWCIAIIASIIMMLAGCGGTTKPHVSIHLLGPHLPYRSAVACVSADCGPYAVTLSWAGISVSGLAGYYITAQRQPDSGRRLQSLHLSRHRLRHHHHDGRASARHRWHKQRSHH